jgi:hypothetical protein
MLDVNNCISLGLTLEGSYIVFVHGPYGPSHMGLTTYNLTKILIHWFTDKLLWFGIFLFGGLWLEFSGNYHDNLKSIAAFAHCYI